MYATTIHALRSAVKSSPFDLLTRMALADSLEESGDGAGASEIRDEIEELRPAIERRERFLAKVREEGGCRVWVHGDVAEWLSPEEFEEWFRGVDFDEFDERYTRHQEYLDCDGNPYRDEVVTELDPMPDPEMGLARLAYFGAHAGRIWEAEEYGSDVLQDLLNYCGGDATMLGSLGVAICDDWDCGDDGHYWLISDEARLNRVAALCKKTSRKLKKIDYSDDFERGWLIEALADKFAKEATAAK